MKQKPIPKNQHEKFTINTGQEETVERIHTGIRDTDELSTPVESDHPSNTSGRQQVGIPKYPDEDQRKHVATDQPEVEINNTEETHEAPRGGNLEEGSCDEAGPNSTTYQKESRDWCYSTNHNTDRQKFSIQDIATS